MTVRRGDRTVTGKVRGEFLGNVLFPGLHNNDKGMSTSWKLTHLHIWVLLFSVPYYFNKKVRKKAVIWIFLKSHPPISLHSCKGDSGQIYFFLLLTSHGHHLLVSFGMSSVFVNIFSHHPFYLTSFRFFIGVIDYNPESIQE